MSLEDFITDDIIVRNQNGDVLEGLRASIQRDNIFLDRSNVLIEPRDLIERRISNGAVETFEVIDPGIQEAFNGIKARFQPSDRTLVLPEAKSALKALSTTSQAIKPASITTRSTNRRTQ